MGSTYVWFEGGVQHARFQPPKIEVLEERVLLHFPGPSPSAAQAFQGIFAQELQHKGTSVTPWCFGQEQPCCWLLRYICRNNVGSQGIQTLQTLLHCLRARAREPDLWQCPHSPDFLLLHAAGW